MNKFLLPAICCIMAYGACGANVEWSDLTISYYGKGRDWGYSDDMNIYQCWKSASEFATIFFSPVGDNALLFLNDNSEFEKYAIAVRGDIIDETYFYGESIAGYCADIGEDGVYVGFENYGNYGWIHISLEGHTLSADGAIDITGASIYVGGLIPEPSSGLLLLLGIAGLALRRSRG